MRPWMIVLSSAIVAVAVAGAMVEPELLEAPRSDFGLILLRHFSMLAVAALAVYALCAMLLATGTLIGDGLSVRRRLERLGSYPRPTQRDWTTAFGSTELHRLVPSSVAGFAPQAGANKTILLQHRFATSAARGEIARLHYLWLARTHFFSALIVLTALVGLGLAQDHGSVPLSLGQIPAISAILMTVGLILLAILGRIAIDVSTEPLIEMISQLAAEPVEIGLLRRLVEVLEVVCTATTVNAGAPASTLQLRERLEVVIEAGQRGLADAARHLSVTTDALGATIESSIDALKTAIRTAAAQLPPTVDLGSEAFGFSELQVAVEALTAVLERLTIAPEAIQEPSPSADQAAGRKIQEPHLARELRQLLQEIGTAR
ncbi:MAG: hypothetical protein JO282_13435 [Alphaproteobacteria bacterium]|nr:hypothetical protein [Alphaproteobacteria bacterium]